MKYRYFREVKTEEDLKKQYRANVKLYHPDSNPEERGVKFNEMMKEYEHLLQYKNFTETQTSGFAKSGLDGKDMIDFLYEHAVRKGWKPGSVYYSYKEYLVMKGEEPELDDLRYLGDLLGYAKTWAIIKYNEILNELNRLH